MAIRDKAPMGAPCWIELMSSNADLSRRFYGELFGWTATDPNPELGGYVNFLLGDEPVAGMMANNPQWGAPDGWMVYLAVANAESRCEQARRNGATILAGPHPVGDLGTMVVATDADGAGIGMWQSGTHPGFRVLDEAGTPAHFELHTRDYERSLRFYENVFGWSTFLESDTDDFRYTGVGTPEHTVAGVMDAERHLARGVSSHWTIYYRVEDTDRALEQISRLGGSVLSCAANTPYGRLAEVADPTGAQFRIVAG